jgi:hypothetical protein
LVSGLVLAHQLTQLLLEGRLLESGQDPVHPHIPLRRVDLRLVFGLVQDSLLIPSLFHRMLFHRACLAIRSTFQGHRATPL